MGEVLAFPARPQQHWLGPVAREPDPLWRELVGRELRAERTRQERTLSDVAGEAADALDRRAVPEAWRQGDLTLPLSYVFDPGAARHEGSGRVFREGAGSTRPLPL